MRYLIITYDDYFNIPYILNYESCMKQHGIDYDIVLWNRGESTAPHPDNHLVFTHKDSSNKVSKIAALLAWRRYVLRVLRQKHYDKVIVLTTLPGVLLHHVLVKQYNKNYWFDVRDFTYEQVPFYKTLVADLVRKAQVTSISSKAFLDFLPESDNIVLTHNITNTDHAQQDSALDLNKRPITIAFVGGIQYQHQNELLLHSLGNDPDFMLKYIGKVKPNCTLPAFCAQQQIHNVEFLPVYRNEEKPQIYQSIDLINSIYGNTSKITCLALPNKLYDCILFKKPILVSSGTYLAEIVKEYHIGLALDLETDPVDQRIREYLDHFDPDVFRAGCNRLLEVVLAENQKYTEALECFCSKKGTV